MESGKHSFGVAQQDIGRRRWVCVSGRTHGVAAAESAALFRPTHGVAS
jgi:hypothetical protein